VFGAQEVKSVSRFARENSAKWKPIHSAIVGCLMAHTNKQSGLCCPSRKLIAEHCNVSERTVDRAISQLREWGAIKTVRLKLQEKVYGPAQYTLLFDQRDIALSRSNATNSGGQRDRKTIRQRDTALSTKAVDLKQELISGEVCEFCKGTGVRNFKPPRKGEFYCHCPIGIDRMAEEKYGKSATAGG
jgi:hypothetical protein